MIGNLDGLRKRVSTLLPGLILLLLLTSPSLAQDLRDLEPKPVPQQVEAPEGEIKPPEPGLPGALDETVMVEALRGVIFINSQDQLQDRPPVPANGLDAGRVPNLQTPEARKIADEHLGKPVSMVSLTRLAGALYLYYSEIDLPFVNITLPEQDITNGVVQFLVIETRLGEITIDGARYFSEDLYRSQLRLRPGKPIRKTTIDEDVDWINRNPFRQGGMFLAPGEEVGTTNLALRVNERLPLRVYAGYSNNGTDLTDKNRLNAGFNWGNAFGLGHQLSYQLTGSRDFNRLIAHSGSYVIPLPWRHFLIFSGAYSESKYDVPAPLSQYGRSGQASLTYQAELKKIGAYTHTLSGLFDFKLSDNNLEFGGIPVTDNITHILQFGVQYNGSLPDRWGTTSFIGRLIYSPGDLDSRNKTGYFSISRAFAEPDYTYININLMRNQGLPFDFSLFVEGTIQFASGTLLGSEQISFGGANAVRGYDESSEYGDEGYLLKIELRAPLISLAPKFNLKGIQDQLQVFGFLDYGVSKNVDLLPGEDPSVILQSLGLGLRYYLARNFSMNVAYGWQQKALEGLSLDHRAHVSVSLSY
jgi:hemolysin activation/secretion protein